jgi:hypothetical protein
MRTNSMMRTAAETNLLINAARDAFFVPGESDLAVLHAFCDRDIRVTVCQPHEGGAAMVGKAPAGPGLLCNLRTWRDQRYCRSLC